MEYLYVAWNHNFSDEPIEFYMEIDNDRNQKRVVEIFKDGHKAFASDQIEFGTFLAKERLSMISVFYY